jgi:enoyl-CoA hydratase/carnithine racemase
MSSFVVTEEKNGVLVMIINRADKKNALTQEMYTALADGIERVEAEPSLRAVLITGVDGSFTSGNDLNDFLNQPPQGEESPVHRFLRKIATTKVPLVAAVNGVAVGVGVTMLLHCDLVYAAKSAKLMLPFVNLALVPEAASSLILPRIAGYQKAAELLMLGDPFTPEQGFDAGFINAVCEDEDLLAHATAKAEALAAKPPESLRLTKSLLKGDLSDVSTRMSEEGKIFGERLASGEAREAMTAVMEKRAPDFSKFQ